ncbi:MAG TPA: glycosyltransferase family 4 protein [Rariglobus sp.]|jgi:glycosyltransferase involved in cell wall biosynthesis|nr:glycosyltransferase family 4 protein [Rariglobus sp.]
MSASARILIISNGALCRNPRVLKEATTLGLAGHDVTVLTVRNHPPSEQHDLRILLDAPFRRKTVDTAAGVSADRLRPLYRRMVHKIARTMVSRLHFETASALGPAGPLLNAARQIPSDLVIVHNEVAHWVGTRLIKEGRRVCADIEDWHSEDLLPDQQSARPLGLIRNTERTLLHHAVHTTTTSHALADALHERYGGHRPCVITNSFPLQPDPDMGSTGDSPSFFWFSQTLGPGRGLELFMAAWKLTTMPSRLVLLGETSDDYAQRLLAGLPPDRQRLVSFLPLVSPDELPAVIARHDIGLALEQAFIPNRNLTITNKILQYLNAGLAVVASDTAGQCEVLSHAPDAGIIVQSHETTGFARQLDDLLADREALFRRRRAARLIAQTLYCWEKEAPRLLGLASHALSKT